jgi:hypothetical protein
MKAKSKDSGKLRIGDDWNAIRIIALSQSNPLKAIAEFMENSIDAHAKTITITRGKEQGAHYLAIKDDGDGVPRDGSGLQGEFGIGLLSFWTVGDMLTVTSTGTDQRAYQMTMSKGDSSYEVNPKRLLFAEKGTELKINPLLEGRSAGCSYREQPASGTFREAFLAHFREGLFDFILNLLGRHTEVLLLRGFEIEMKELPANRIGDELRNRALAHAGLRQVSS